MLGVEGRAGGEGEVVLALVLAAGQTLLLAASLVTMLSDTARVPALEVAAVAMLGALAMAAVRGRGGGLAMVEDLATASDLLAMGGGVRFQRLSWRDEAGLGEELEVGWEVNQPTSLLVVKSQASSTLHGPLEVQ